MITDYKGWPSAAEKSAARPKLSPKIGDDQNLRPRSTGHHVVHHKIQCGFPRFSPPSAIFIFSKRPKFCRKFSKILERISGIFENLRNDTRILHSSAKTARAKLAYLQNLPNLPTSKNLQNLRCRSAHCLQPSAAVPLQGGGRSSERCSEGPDVLLYTSYQHCRTLPTPLASAPSLHPGPGVNNRQRSHCS